MLARWPILAGALAILAGALLSITLIRTPEHQERGSCPPPAEQLTPRMFRWFSNGAQDRGFLWRISKGGHTSYLYGTVHIAKQGLMFPGRTVRAAFDASDRLAVEVDILDPNIRARVHKSLSALDENNLPLPEPLLNRIRTFAGSVCFSLWALDEMSPEATLDALVFHVPRYDGLYVEYGIDAFLSWLARSIHKPVVSLENPEFLAQAVRVNDESDRILRATARVEALESGRMREFALRAVKIWAESRFDELLRYKEWCECFDTDAQRRYWSRATEDRNRIQALAINALHERGHNVFAAVGYAHMVGDAGLPSLLEQMGYQVKFVAF
jgi:uncharacterized protein